MAFVAHSELFDSNDNRRSEPDFEALAQIASLAAESLHLDEVLPKALAGIGRYLPADHIAVLREEAGTLVVSAYASTNPKALRAHDLYAKRGLVDGMAAEEFRFRGDDEERVRRILPYLVGGAGSALIVPLSVDAAGIGRLDIIREDGRTPFTETERRFAEACGKVLSLAIRNSTEYARVAWLAEHDPLTGLGNRRQFDRALSRELSRAERYERNLSLLLIDIDDFKAVNSLLGLSGGDDVLRRIGRVLAGSARQGVDVSCRIGGDEFAMILPEIDAEAAEELAQRLLREVGKATAPVLPVQFSYSVSTYPRIGAEQFRGHADSRLLDAKTQKGRCGALLSVVR